MNKEFLGERRRALEEEYFGKLNRALIERLRAAQASNVRSGGDHGRRVFGIDASPERLATEEP